MKCKRKSCFRQLQKKALYFANQIAINHGYCNYVCFLVDDKETCEQEISKFIQKRKKQVQK